MSIYAFEYEAVVIDGEVYCIDCAPPTPSEDVVPIFADSEWEKTPHCCVCSQPHDYVQVLIPDEFSDEEVKLREAFAENVARLAEVDDRDDPDFLERLTFRFRGYHLTADCFQGSGGKVMATIVVRLDPDTPALAVTVCNFAAPFPDSRLPSLIVAGHEDGSLDRAVKQARSLDPESAKIASRRFGELCEAALH